MPLRIRMMFTGFLCGMGRMEMMAMGKVGVVSGGFRITTLMLSCRFAVMTRGMFVVLSGFGMMLYSGVWAHIRSSSLVAKMQESVGDGDDIRMTQP